MINRRDLLKSIAAAGGLGAFQLAQGQIPTLPNSRRAATLSSSHFGSFMAQVEGGRFVRAVPFEKDPHPSPIIQGMPDRVYSASRVKYPMVRASFLKSREKSDPTLRGSEPFVQVSWDEALDLVAEELTRVRDTYGHEAIFGGSYGWMSAGKLHQAQILTNRFLGQFGGYVGQVYDYSIGAGEVIVPHIVGSMQPIFGPLTTWSSIEKHSELLVLWGATPLKNSQIAYGGCGEHSSMAWLERIQKKGTEVAYINPVQEDDFAFFRPKWVMAPRPNTDVALMLAMSHTLLEAGRQNQEFIDRYTFGFDRFAAYLNGETDGVVKNSAWAAKIADVPEDQIRALAYAMAEKRTMLVTAPALQRQDHGEQAFFATIGLASILGQIGLPGGGFGFGYIYNGMGTPGPVVKPDLPNYEGLGASEDGGSVGMPVMPGISSGQNPLKLSIPAARMGDLLNEPGKTIDFNGNQLTYPDIKMIYWAGGNPFHHHQDTGRLIGGWRRPETVIVHELVWTATAKHADIVLPATTEVERNDISQSGMGVDRFIIAMKQAIPALYGARSDYQIFSDLSQRLGFADKFSEGRDEMGWLRFFYDMAGRMASARGVGIPEFDEFWQQGYLEFPASEDEYVMFSEFRADPAGAPLGTGSGKIELYSPVLEKFGYSDCPPHPAWLEPAEWLGGAQAEQFPIALVSPHPKYRLHSQMDHTWLRNFYEIGQREPVWINPADAEARGIENGDLVRIFNDRGSLLAGAWVTKRIRPGVIRLEEGGWYDPLDPKDPKSLDKHGNANTLTLDKGTSSLAQSTSAHTTLVQIERYTGAVPDVTAFDPPPTQDRA